LIKSTPTEVIAVAVLFPGWASSPTEAVALTESCFPLGVATGQESVVEPPAAREASN
jgi:hypothetical protein